MNVTCVRCNKPQMKVRGHKGKSRYAYLNADGRRWEGNSCPTCLIPVKSERNSRRPRCSIDLSTAHHTATGRRSEQVVASYFKELGHSVKLTRCKGPDLLVSYVGEELAVEVKTVSRNKGSTALYVSSVSPSRIHDDLVALVFPDGKILIETMSAHLAKCGSSGKRSVTTQWKEAA